MAFEDHIQGLVIDHLKISRKEVLEIEMINAVGYSGAVLSQVSALIERNDLEGLEDEELNNSDNPDTFSIYKIILLNKKYIALIFEPFELYNNTQILKMVEIQ